MPDYYYATILYHSGDKVRLVHKGKEPTKATMKLLAPIGASIEVGEPLPLEKQQEYEKLAEAVSARNRHDRRSEVDAPGGDDA